MFITVFCVNFVFFFCLNALESTKNYICTFPLYTNILCILKFFHPKIKKMIARVKSSCSCMGRYNGKKIRVYFLGKIHQELFYSENQLKVVFAKIQKCRVTKKKKNPIGTSNIIAKIVIIFIVVHSWQSHQIAGVIIYLHTFIFQLYFFNF